MIDNILEIAFVILVSFLVLVAVIDTLRYSIKMRRFEISPLVRFDFPAWKRWVKGEE